MQHAPPAAGRLLIEWPGFLVQCWPIDALLPSAEARLGELSPAELAAWRQIASPARRLTWLAGRVALKESLRPHLAAQGRPPIAPAQIHIESRDAQGRPSRPIASLAGEPCPTILSLSHTDEHVLVGLAFGASAIGEGSPGIGVDLTPALPLGEGFQQTWFTPSERAWIARSGDPLFPARLWTAKEAAYKGVNRGEPFVPAALEIFADDRGIWSFRQLGEAPASKGPTVAPVWTLEIRQHGALLVSIARTLPQAAD